VANHPSALKRDRQSQKRRNRNRTIGSGVKTAVKKILTAITEKSDDTPKKLQEATAALNRAASKGVLPKKRASRKISRLTKKTNKAFSS